MEVWKCKYCGNMYSFKIEADFAIDPIWCGNCGVNIDLHFFPLSTSLKEDLLTWGNNYGKWIDFESDTLLKNGLELEKKFNKLGMQLAERVKNELGEKITVTFLPLRSAQSYKDINRI